MNKQRVVADQRVTRVEIGDILSLCTNALQGHMDRKLREHSNELVRPRGMRCPECSTTRD